MVKQQFKDKIPYPNNINLEMQRRERKRTRRVLEELGATSVAARENEIDSHSFFISGIMDEGADINRIKEVLHRRGGRNFQQQPIAR